ncbi:MAG TPA: DNA polymerase IV [Patescibacteria group bacterium]|jgi:DNA polymerase-4|nr:DNA polymerase IV [Patescibacteria group bacterium]
MEPIIAHIDMNSYFATCEQQDEPQWRGKPLGVCEHLGGIIIAASVEAKLWGIKTGTPVWEAKKLFPKIILTKTNPARYRFYTARFLKVFEDYTDKIEKYSIDEAFLDLTKSCNIRTLQPNGKWELTDPWEEAARIIKEIKVRMKTEVGDWIRCSAGVSYSKLVAKIASDLQKPDGLTIVRPQDKDSLYTRLKLDDVPGIGRRMKRNLGTLGIKTLANLRDYPLSKLVAHYGIQGYHLHSMGQLQGSWKENFDETLDASDSTMKSIGHMYTVPQEYRDKKVLKSVLYKLSEMVGARLRVNSVMGNGLHVFCNDPDGLRVGKGARMGYYLQDGRDIYLEAMNLLESTGQLRELENRSYLIGVTVSGLTAEEKQGNLFESSRDSKTHSQLMHALDKINNKYEDFTVARVPAFLARDIIRDSVGFGRMKEFKTTFVRGGQGGFK